MAAKKQNRPKSAVSSKPVSSKPVAGTPPKPAAPPSAPALFQPGFWAENWIPALLLLVLPWAVYAACINFGYVLDDQMVIWENAYVRKGLRGLREIFAYDSFMGYFQKPQTLLEGGRYRPLSLATFALEREWLGPNQTKAAHAINIVLYGVTGILLYRITAGLMPKGENGKWYFSLAFLTALLFVLHPLHVEVVANIKGRDEILALLGSLGALYAALKYSDSPKVSWLIWSGLLLFLACLAKENSLTFLAVIPLTQAFFRPAGSRHVGPVLVPLVIASLGFLLVRYNALGYMLNPGSLINDLMNNPFVGMTTGGKFATIFLTLGWYLKLLVVPYPLTHDYYPYHVPKVNWADWRPLLSFALHAGMAVWAVLNFNKRKFPAYTILYYLITLSIVSNLIVSVGAPMNERFLYMPSVGYCLLIAWLLTRLLPGIFKETADRPYIIGATLAVGILGVYAWIGYKRVPDWKDTLTLNSSAIRTSPESARANCFYAQALYQEVYAKTKDPQTRAKLADTIQYHVNKALEIYPKYGNAWVMKGIAASARFDADHQMNKLFHEYDIILDNIPENPIFRKNMNSYLEYLATNGGNADIINTFCYHTGYERFYKERKDPAAAIQILEYGLLTQAEDERILDALAECYQALNNEKKANEMRERAKTARAAFGR